MEILIGLLAAAGAGYWVGFRKGVDAGWKANDVYRKVKDAGLLPDGCPEPPGL